MLLWEHSSSHFQFIFGAVLMECNRKGVLLPAGLVVIVLVPTWLCPTVLPLHAKGVGCPCCSFGGVVQCSSAVQCPLAPITHSDVLPLSHMK